MIKIVCLFVFALIGAAFSLPASDSVNQRDPVQIKISNENPPISPLDNNESNDPPAPFVDSDLKESFNRDPEANKDENLEPAETFGFGYGLGLGYSGWGGRYNGYSGYGGWGRGYSGYGGYGYPGYGGYGRRHGYGGYGRRSYYY